MRMIPLLLIVVLLNFSALAADPEPYLKFAPMPFYPPIAHSAHIEGKVSIHFAVDEQGNTSEVEASTGHELLRRAAVESVQGWKFGWPNPCACRVKKEALFTYKFSGQLESSERPVTTIKWFGRTGIIRVEIESDLVQIQTQVSQ